MRRDSSLVAVWHDGAWAGRDVARNPLLAAPSGAMDVDVESEAFDLLVQDALDAGHPVAPTWERERALQLLRSSHPDAGSTWLASAWIARGLFVHPPPASLLDPYDRPTNPPATHRVRERDRTGSFFELPAPTSRRERMAQRFLAAFGVLVLVGFAFKILGALTSP